MSTLEERREARRRRRQQEESGPQLNGDDDLDERLSQRRRERESRLKLIAAGVNAINGEDELERRRRERREQRLRSSEVAEDTSTSNRRTRRRGTEDEIDATEESSYTSTRSRRRRGYDEEETPEAAPEEPQVDPEEAARKRRAAQAEQERQEEEERARREEEEEERQRQEEIRRQQEEERRKQDEERRRQEEAERAKREEIDNILDRQKKEREEQEIRINERIRNLQSVNDTVNDDLFIDEDDWNNHTNNSVHGNKLSDMERRKLESNKTSQLKTFFEDRMEEQKSNELHLEIHRKDGSNKRQHPGNLSLDESSQSHVQERLIKYQSSLQISPKDASLSPKDLHVYHAKVISPGSDRLKDIQKRFEGEKSNGDLSNNRLGRLSASETHLNITEKTESPRFGSKKVLDRWQPAHNSQKSPLATSFKATSTTNMDSGASRKSGTVTLLASKFATSKESLNDNHVTSPTTLKHSGSFKDVSSIRRHWSESRDLTEKSEPAPSSLRRQKSMGAKVSERWQFEKQDGASSSKNNKEPSSPFKSNRESPSYQESQLISPCRSRPLSTSSSDSQKDVVVATPVTITTNGWHRTNGTKEEEERIERERLEREEQEREEAARRMEEEQKKRNRKRKGLGGLDKEKKNKLKALIMAKAAEDLRNEAKAKAEEKERYINERVPPCDTQGKDKAALIKLCKDLHTLMATLEEEVYDWNMKVRKQEGEINSLSLKVNDSKGKFVKPVLRKVNKESKFDKLKKDKSDFRGNLKSTGQSKYALDEEGEEKAE
ncbi:trichohyalin-like isoform X4 [Crassostrea angulata]|uniref:trichohyalin-like isoform X4 n=1 Tax=Magallana angulata TaxID=2784310 RepID=UPI0022B0CA71|nr:trichohyalin-like isoform X4 [Crassostrea angulata]